MAPRISEKVALELMRSAGLEPLVPFVNSRTKWKSRCAKCNRVVQPALHNIKNGHQGCVYCSGKRVDPIDAENLFLKNKLKPISPFSGAKSPWPSKCLICGAKVKPRYSDVLHGQGGCLDCGYRTRGEGQRLEEYKAIQIMLDAGLQPLEKYTNFDTKWKSQCLECRKIVCPSLHSIKSGQGGCRYCGRKIAAGKKRIKNEIAKKRLIDAGYQPLEEYKSARTKWKCLHLKCGSEVWVRYSHINRGLGGCLSCGYLVSASKNRRVESEAIQLMLDAGFQPLESYKSANRGWKALHLECGKVVSPRLNHITSGRGGCKYCGKGGLNYNTPALIYLMHHIELQSIKIGVSNIDSHTNRIDTHQIYGWSLYRSLTFETGEEAHQTEQRILLWLREEKKLPIHLSSSDMPQRGFSETVDASEIDLATIWAKVEQLSRVSL